MSIAITLVGLLLIFHAFFERSYLEWYADTGPFIAVASAAFAAAWGDLDDNPALISPHPLIYLGACLQIAGLPLFAIGTHLRTENRLKPVGFELPMVLLLGLVLVVAVLGWLLLVVPAQYFLFLLVGSLSRVAATSSAHISARVNAGQVELSQQPQHELKSEDGWWDATMRRKPFSLTNAFGAVLLFLVSLCWQ